MVPSTTARRSKSEEISSKEESVDWSLVNKIRASLEDVRLGRIKEIRPRRS